jgi:hypothetical protein
MDRTETVAKGRSRQAPVGETWDDHASMAPEQIRDQLAAALQAYGGPSVAPHFKIEEIEESGDRLRFDIGYDIREHFTTSTCARIRRCLAGQVGDDRIRLSEAAESRRLWLTQFPQRQFQKSGLSAVGTAGSFSVLYLSRLSAQTYSTHWPSGRPYVT